MNSKLSSRLCFLVTCAYNGAQFMGVQEQPQLRTVLGVLRERIAFLAGQQPYSLVVAARTDRGVHALKNYMTFYLKPPLDVTWFMQALKSSNWPDIFVIDVMQVSPHVHARGSAAGKFYRYSMSDADEGCEIHPYAWQIVPNIDINRMRQAAGYLLGEHDFSSFKGGGCQSRNPLKHIENIEIIRLTDLVIVDIRGTGFLRYMIRNIVGMLAECGVGLRDPDEMPGILAAKSRLAAGMMAPPQGLCLMEVILKS